LRQGIFALALTLAIGAAPAYAGAPLSWTAITPISPSGSPYPPGCSGSTTGTNYPGTEVEPWVAVNPADAGNAIAVWQQDRFTNGGANSLRAAYSSGGQWLNPASQPGFSVCSGGTGDAGGYERASDPWVSFSSDGKVAYFMALVFNQSTDLTSAMTVSRSFDGGQTWEQTPTVLKRDPSRNVLNDKNSLTADRSLPGNAYAIWDRLVFPNERSKGMSFENAAAYYGPTWFARTTDGGATWEPARKIWDPGQEQHNSGRNDQSIGNQIVQTGTGDLVDVFTWINNDNAGGRKGYKIGVIRSPDHGDTWSNATLVSHFTPGVVHDPTTGDRVRTGDIIAENAIDPRAGSDTAYIVWQGASATSPSSVYFSKSADGGQTWSAPAIINKVTSTQAFTPSIRVDKNGAITVTYYDFRNDDSSTPLTTDYWSIVSRDGGATWDESHIDGPFDQRGAAIARGFFLGDYAGLAAGENSDVFHAVFGKATGTFDAKASDIEASDGQ
jgi:Neuraminidase (sialidase)